MSERLTGHLHSPPLMARRMENCMCNSPRANHKDPGSRHSLKMWAIKTSRLLDARSHSLEESMIVIALEFEFMDNRSHPLE
jgi:hypothetical protein